MSLPLPKTNEDVTDPIDRTCREVASLAKYSAPYLILGEGEYAARLPLLRHEGNRLSFLESDYLPEMPRISRLRKSTNAAWGLKGFICDAEADHILNCRGIFERNTARYSIPVADFVLVPGSLASINRRGSHRINLEREPVAEIFVLGTNLASRGEVLNIASEGLAFRSPTPFPLGTILNLSFCVELHGVGAYIFQPTGLVTRQFIPEDGLGFGYALALGFRKHIPLKPSRRRREMRLLSEFCDRARSARPNHLK